MSGTIAEKYERKLQQDRERQQKYYAANKAKIVERRKAKRASDRAIIASCKNPPAEPIPEPTPEPPVVAAADKPVFSAWEGLKNQKTGKRFKKKRILTEDYLVDYVRNNMTSVGTNESNIKRLFIITKCNDLRPCLNEGQKLIKKINEGMQPNGQPYAWNSIKATYSTIVYIIDHLDGLKEQLNEEAVEDFKNEFAKYKHVSKENSKEKVENATVVDWKDYLEAIEKTFGATAKETVIAKVYYEMPVRDDLQLKIVNKAAETTDANTNYLIVPRVGTVIGINQQYKTSKKYGKVQYKFSESLSKLIREYIDIHKLAVGDYIFGKGLLSKFVSDMGKKAGYKVNITDTRHMSAAAAKNKPLIERIKLAAKMNHSIGTHVAVYANNVTPVPEPAAAEPKKGRKKKV